MMPAWRAAVLQAKLHDSWRALCGQLAELQGAAPAPAPAATPPAASAAAAAAGGDATTMHGFSFATPGITPSALAPGAAAVASVLPPGGGSGVLLQVGPALCTEQPLHG